MYKEYCFVGIREVNGSEYSGEVRLIPGRMYEVYILGVNDVSPTLAGSSGGKAPDVRARSSFPGTVTLIKKENVYAGVSSSDARSDPILVRAYLSADEDVALEYVPNSLKLYPSDETHGRMLDPGEFFSKDGARIETGLWQVKYCLKANHYKE